VAGKTLSIRDEHDIWSQVTRLSFIMSIFEIKFTFSVIKMSLIISTGRSQPKNICWYCFGTLTDCMDDNSPKSILFGAPWFINRNVHIPLHVSFLEKRKSGHKNLLFVLITSLRTLDTAHHRDRTDDNKLFKNHRLRKRLNLVHFPANLILRIGIRFWFLRETQISVDESVDSWSATMFRQGCETLRFNFGELIVVHISQLDREKRTKYSNQRLWYMLS
jgi:hypothetical protein